MIKNLIKYPWHNKIINNSVVGGIETAVMNNGLAKGVRIAWINTGSGLRYKVVVDRSLDIAEAFYNQYCLSWMTHVGVTPPNHAANINSEWLHSFGGGFLATCGLTHIGQAESDENENRGMHGRIGNLPAEIESIIQPDPLNGKMQMSISGVIKESKFCGPSLELRRTISSTIGEAKILIRDVVQNVGSTPVPHMILYHCNYGWPLVDEGTEIIWKGTCTNEDSQTGGIIFTKKNNYRKCPEPSANYSGNRTSVGFIDVTADSNDICTIGLYNRKLGLAIANRYRKKQLPCMTNWQHMGLGEYVCALEPGTNYPIGQNQARQDKTLIFIMPGDIKTYELEWEILTEEKKIEEFVSANSVVGNRDKF